MWGREISNSMVNGPIKWWGQLLVAAINVVGLLLFCRGFFPQKQLLPGVALFHQADPFAKPPFSKVVVMVVDAMRSDMLYGNQSHMNYFHKLMDDGVVLPYTAYAHPPTVTLPRLKGITLGLTPSFLDAIMNINEEDDTSLNLDLWIGQFVGRGANIHFYGDDTWLKLFPKEFTKTDGTNSFYVSDFTEVDHNVTRHLDEELKPSSKWDGLILHYLGLDHIGHKGGPHSPYMESKQHEMDKVIQRLYEYINKNQDTVLVVMGDHGMNEIGNHGGALAGEVSPGLALISPKFKKLDLDVLPPHDVENFQYYRPCTQIDLVPTLSALLGLPIPKNNVGVVLKEILPLFKRRGNVIRENALQMALLAGHTVPANFDELDEKELYHYLHEIQDDLALTATNYNYDDIYTGLGLLVLSCGISLVLFSRYYLWGSNSKRARQWALISVIVTILYSSHFHGLSLIEEEHHIWWVLAVLVALGTGNVKWSSAVIIGLRVIKAWSNSGQKYWLDDKIGLYLVRHPDVLWALVVLTYVVNNMLTFTQGNFVSALNFFAGNARATDFKLLGSLIGFILLFVTMSVLLSFKLVQYWADGHDVPAWLSWLYYWVLTNYDINPHNPNAGDDKQLVGLILVQLSNALIYFMSTLLVVSLVSAKFKGIKGGYFSVFANFFTLYLIHHSRVENIPIFIAFAVVKYCFMRSISSIKLDVDYRLLLISAFTLVVSNLLFFSMGFTNSLATVDLSNAYNGVLSYNLLLVGWLTFVSNFAGPLYWLFSSLQMIFEPSVILYQQPTTADLIYLPRICFQVLSVKLRFTFMFYLIAAVTLMALCVNLRFHLFIWLVFSPKILFFGVWAVFMNLFIDYIVGLLLLLLFK